MSKDITRGSGNIFADIGLSDAADYKVKADLAMQVIQIIDNRKLTQKEAAALIGAKQPDISKLKSGNLKGFTIDRLLSFLLKLDRSVQIHVTKPRAKSKQGILETVAA